MRKNILLLVLCLAANFAQAQIKAVTDTGEKVTLHEDGTWEYEKKRDKDAKEPKLEIPTNPTVFEKPKEASFLLKSTKNKAGFWLDQTKWSFQKAEMNQFAEFEMYLKEGDLFAQVITERIPVPIELLKKAALNNVKAVSSNVKVPKEEFRKVNGLDIFYMEMEVELEGMTYAYKNYYFSDDSGTTQFMVYTFKGLMEEKAEQAEKILNGLVMLKE